MFEERVAMAARAWIGTPYVHQASARGAGTDCLGLIRGVWREIVGPETREVPAYSADWDEVGHQDILWTAARDLLVPKDKASHRSGDVILFRMAPGAVAKHLGIATVRENNPCFVHAYARVGVVETTLTESWQRKIVARFEFPN